MVNPALSMAIVVGLFVWMLIRPASRTPAKIFLFIVATMIFGPLSVLVMDFEKTSVAFKFDHHLQLIDNALGISAFWLARRFSPWHRSFLFIVYETLGYWMILWYGLNLRFKHGKPRQLLISYLLSYGLAPVFYLIVPACGPRHAFGSIFPMRDPAVTAVRVPLDFWPNAIPSLHFTSAILLLHFSGGNRFWRCFAWLYLVGTAAATLAFEHYTIDLVVAVPYAYWVICLAEGRMKAAAANLAIALAWLVSIRYGTPAIVSAPVLLKIAAIVTMMAGWITGRWGSAIDSRESGRLAESGAAGISVSC
jgi:hypothetical protein